MFVTSYHAFSSFLRGEYVSYDRGRYTDIPLTEPSNNAGDDKQGEVVRDCPQGIGSSHSYLCTQKS